MKILITGSQGYIGSRLMNEIKALGMDIKSGQDVCKGIEGRHDVIVHLAALMNGERGMYKNNVEATKKVVGYCKVNRTRLVFASSAAVYGDAGLYPTREDHPLEPINEYGESKVACEKIIERELKDYVIFRLSNVSMSPGGAMARFKAGESTIYGDGTNVRDFVELDDVINYLTMATKGVGRGTFNLSSGMGFSINKMYEVMSGGVPRYAKARQGDIKVSILDNTKLKQEFL